MAERSALTDFKEGVRLLQEGFPADAYACFHRASELETQNPYYLSFLGVSLGRAEKKWDRAVGLCKSALSMKRNEPQLHLNLAEAYRGARNRDAAIDLLDQALAHFKGDDRFEKARAGLGKRRLPVFSLLEREHFLNRYCGKIRHRILGPVSQEISK